MISTDVVYGTLWDRSQPTSEYKEGGGWRRTIGGAAASLLSVENRSNS